MSKYIMDWEQLLSVKRKNENEVKSYIEQKLEIDDYDFDYRRIIQSASFRRLQDKTQVYPLEKLDFIRTRLTHSIEVSAIAEGIGQLTVDYLVEKGEVDINVSSKIPKVLKTAGLIHDLGNPPFGHFGEHIIQNWFKQNLSVLKYDNKLLYSDNESVLSNVQANDLINFDGNAQTFRIVNRLHFDRGNSGLNLTYSVLSTIGKYTTPSDKIGYSGKITNKKIGYYFAETNDIEVVSKEVGTYSSEGIMRHPLTFILEAADDIAYLLSDLEDTFKKKLFSLQDLIIFMNHRMDFYKISDSDKTRVLVSQLERLKESKADSFDYNILNSWLFNVQIHLINVAKYSFTRNYEEIMNGTFNHDLFENTYNENTVKILRDVSIKFAFSNREVNVLELSSQKIISHFLDNIVPGLLKDSVKEQTKIERKYLDLIPNDYWKSYELVVKDLEKEYSEENLEVMKLYNRLLISVDFVSSMTDSFARQLYNDLMGIN